MENSKFEPKPELRASPDGALGVLEESKVGNYIFDKNEFDKLKTNLKEFAQQEAKQEVEKQIQTDKATLISVFGIFASILSFLTIEFQFLKTICSWQKFLGLSLILFALLISFNIALDYLIKSRTDKDIPTPNVWFCGIVLGIFFIGFILMFFGNEEVGLKNKIYQKYSTYFENKLSDFQNRYDQKNEILDSRIKLLDEKIDFKNKAIELKTNK